MYFLVYNFPDQSYYYYLKQLCIQTVIQQRLPVELKCKNSNPVKIYLLIHYLLSKRGMYLFDTIFFSILLFSDGRKEYAMFDKITSRISKLSEGLDLDYIDPVCKA